MNKLNSALKVSAAFALMLAHRSMQRDMIEAEPGKGKHKNGDK
jgi:hypothetical protein